MVTNNFEDPQSFLAGGIFNYLDANSKEGADFTRMVAIAKRFPQHFRVLERVPGFDNRFLTVGPESDYPAEAIASQRHADSIVVATLVKERLTTWAAIDWLAGNLSKALGRQIFPEQIRHSGLKDRWAETTQTIAIIGVTVDELRRLTWPYSQGRTGFFLKDIRWHDARRRLHTVQDERRNRAWTEVAAQLVLTKPLSADTVSEQISQVLSEKLSRKVLRKDVKVRASKRSTSHPATVYIGGVCVSDLQKVTFPAELGLSLEKVRLNRANVISKGDHRFNRFELKIVVKDKDVATVEAYLAPRMERLEMRGNYIPNAINLQRLAARQKGHLDGYTLLTGDYAPPKGVHAFGTASEAAIYRFLFETTGRENPAAEQLRRDIEACWLYDFPGMKQKLERNYRQLNLSVEYKIAERLADIERYRGDFQAVVQSMSEECSLWVAAWHSYWWNQVLARKLPHWVKLMDDSNKGGKEPYFNPAEKGIPILLDTPEAKRYYERLPYCKDALVHLKKADAFVRAEFLKPHGNNPWRKAFIRVDGLSHSVGTESVDGVEQTVVNIAFNLPAGAYATTFLGFLFELEEPNKGTVRNLAAMAEAEVPDLMEETE